MNTSLSVESRVCAIVVTYNPSPAFSDNMFALGCQAGHIVVIDNGSSCEAEQYLRQMETGANCTVIRNGRNLGIAAALNLGVRYALDAGYEWVATFDQDSRISDGFMTQMLESYRQATHPERIAIVAPTCVDRELGVQHPVMRARNGESLVTMTSGNLVPLRAIQSLGGYDESLYMDYVDVEFCLRARRKGMRILHTPAVLLHSVGKITRHRLFGHVYAATNHPAERRYYITRNRIRLLMNYASDWPWMWREIKGGLSDTVKISLVEANKWEKYRAILMGAADALGGKTGKRIEL